MWKRIVTGIALIGIVLPLVLFGSTALLTAAGAVVVLIALFEYFSLGAAIGHRAYRFWTAFCALVILYLQWLTTAVRFGDFGGIAQPSHLAWLLVRFYPRAEDAFMLFVFGVAVIALATKRPLVETLPAAGISASGLLLVAFPFSFAIRIHGLTPIGPQLLLFALVITWVGDSVAYFVGRAIGKHPLAPHLSPKKTWEGSVGGFLGSLLVGFLFAKWLGLAQSDFIIMAGLGSIAGQVGDLLESAYKRSAGIKDSGTILPGHGGMLDRIDALILTFPVVWYYWVLVYTPRLRP